MNQKITMLLFLIIVIIMINTVSTLATEQIILTGKIKLNEKGQILLKDKVLNPDQNLNIIYVDQNGQELIDLKEIPPNTYAKCFLNSNLEVKYIEISGRLVTSNNKKLSYVYEFKEPVNQFKISYDEKYLAYTDKGKNNLKIIDLATKKIIWKTSGEHICYDWHPQENLLAYSVSQDKNYVINLYDPQTLQSKKIVSIQDNTHNLIEYINFLHWHPQGQLLTYTVIEGLSNAHGYVSGLNLINLSGTVSSLPELSDINYFTWSPSGNVLAYTKFHEANPANSALGIWDFTKNQNITITAANSSAHNPIFSPDDKYLIYCNLNGLIENIIFYNLDSQEIKTLKNELRFINNFQWLNDSTLIYTFGDLPQIMKLDIKNRKSEVISEGFAPFTINKGLYFLKSNPDKQITYLYFYK